jgi:hypothetical protein
MVSSSCIDRLEWSRHPVLIDLNGLVMLPPVLYFKIDDDYQYRMTRPFKLLKSIAEVLKMKKYHQH